MSRFLIFVLVLLAFVAGVGVGAFGWSQLAAGSGEPSQDINDRVERLDEDTDNGDSQATEPSATPVPEEDPPTSEPLTGVSDEDDNDTEPTATATGEPPTSIPDDEPHDDGASGTAVELDTRTLSSDRVLFRINSDESVARFKIDEVLRGDDNTVVGETSQVGGDLIVDFAEPAGSQVGEIVVNARTFETPERFRDSALRSTILGSAQDQYEFIAFQPTSLNGLPDRVTVGDVVDLEITGDLTVKGVTREVTFNAQVTVNSQTRITGTASAEVLYADFGLVIPEVPGVTDVADTVTLEIDFVANAVND